MSEYYDQIREAVSATVFYSPTTYAWFGSPSPRLPAAIRRLLTAETARSYMLHTLQAQLYNDCYCRGGAQPRGDDEHSSPARGRTPFVDALTAANCGRGYWSEGWALVAAEAPEWLVQSGGLHLWVREQDRQTDGQGDVGVGTAVRLRFPKEFLSISPGYYVAAGDLELRAAGAPGLVRVYWNVTADGAPVLVRSLTQALNAEGIPFKLKVLNDPSLYTRCDSAVLYIAASDYADAGDALGRASQGTRAFRNPGTPAFTRRLSSGVGFAEDPGDGESFGLSRCRILAEGMILAHERRSRSLVGRLRVVEECFADRGVSLDRPYLNPGSSADLGESWTEWKSSTRRLGLTLSRSSDTADRSLETASNLGRQVTTSAVWHGGLCNWMGHTLQQRSPGAIPLSATYRALGPELYSGTAGVAVFLADLARRTGDHAARAAALGAIQHAFTQVDTVPPDERAGLYTGWSGIAVAGARVGLALGEEGLVTRSGHLVVRLATSGREDATSCDLLSGLAGAVVAAVILAELMPDQPLLEFAADLGEEVIRRAERLPWGLSWRAPAFSRGRNLTGFSHGAAGVASALVELYAAMGEERYRSAAEAAFGYERHWYDVQSGNWPDFRDDVPARARSRYRPPCGTYWCHGAPGIALSRLRAYQVLGTDTAKAEALLALAVTRQTVEAWLGTGAGNYSLCHGLAGNAEVLAAGSRILGSDWPDGAALARTVGSEGVGRYGSQGAQWPGGAAGGSPDLMLGLAGTGHFYLRLDDPETPSVMLMQRGDLLRLIAAS